MQQLNHKVRKQKPKFDSGFGLIEVLVAALLMAFVLGGISKSSISALTSSANQAERKRIEAAINNNIQLIQMEDSYLQLEGMEDDTARSNACKDPIKTLSDHITKMVPSPNPKNIRNNIVRTLEPTKDDSVVVLTINYKFRSPGTTNSDNNEANQEHRTIDLHPNFAAECYATYDNT